MNLLKKLRIGIAGLAVLGGIALFSTDMGAAGQLSVEYPTERAVYQRNNANMAQVGISVAYSGGAKVQAQILKEDGTSLCEWTPLVKGDDGKYAGALPDIPGGGWYQLVVRTCDSSGAEVDRVTVDKVGVGEVFITGGQSNSCNFGGEKTKAKEDTVSAYNANTGKWQHCEDSQPSNSGFNTGNGGGSPWPSMGDALVKKIGVPVGFISTGVGSAKIEELRTKHYFAIKDAINMLKPYGYRAFLLHQGEADTDGTNRDAYLASLKSLIAQTREDAGYNLNWMIAQVSYAWSNYNNKEKMDSMKETQRAACNDYNIFVGPTTDDLLGDFRHTDNLHLSAKGLAEHGKRWADAVYEKMLSKYNVALSDSIQHGKLVPDKDVLSYNAGDVVSFTAEPDAGYYFKTGSLTINGEPSGSGGTSFNMRAKDVTVSAEFVTRDELAAALGEIIQQAEALDMGKYDEASGAALLKAIEDGKKVAANTAAKAEDLQSASAAVIAAREALVLKLAPTPTPKPTRTPKVSNTPEPEIPSAAPTAIATTAPSAAPTAGPGSTQAPPALPKKGTVITSGALKYTITDSTQTVKTVSVRGLVNKKKTSVTIPKSVTCQGFSYSVTAIEKKAFYKAKKLKKVTIKSLSIKKIGKKAFQNVNAKIKIKVPSSRLKAYKKLLKGKGLKKTAKITK